MSVLIVIPAKNPRDDDLQQQVEAISRQDFESFEVVYLNSGSETLVERLESRGLPNFRVVAVKPDEYNHGLTRNLALELADEVVSHIAFLTHDAIPLNETWLRNLLKPMIDDDLVAFSFGSQNLLPTANCVERELMTSHFDFFSSRGPAVLGSKKWLEKNDSYRQRLHFNSNANSAYSLKALRAQPFPETDFGEDQLVADAFIRSGLRGAYSEGAEVLHDNRLRGLDIFRRAYDESRYFKVNFGYSLGSNPLVSIIKTSMFLRSKAKTAPGGVWSICRLSFLFRALLSNMGHLAGRFFSHSEALRSFVSRDHRMKQTSRQEP
jgi:rhamnosyltransferase